MERNEFYNTAGRDTNNPVTPINIDGGRKWVVRDNYIHDHWKAQGNQISYAAFFKSNGLFDMLELHECRDEA